MGLKALVLAKLDRSEQALEYIRQQLADYPLSYTLHYARWAIGRTKIQPPHCCPLPGDVVPMPASWRVG